MNLSSLPIVVIGAGPVGLAAAAQLLQHKLPVIVLEAGEAAGDALRQWAQVRMFSPWDYNLDRASVALLEAEGWQAPVGTEYPSGGELRERYLLPLAATPALAPHIRYRHTVSAISRRHRDRMATAQREQQPFLLRYRNDDGEHELLARAVIDASGTFATPNPLGASGLPALGERALGAYIDYGLPDVRGVLRQRYAGQRVLVVGSGHSAFNVLSELVALQREEPATEVHWAVRRPSLARVLGGGENDQLQERGRLGLRIRALVESGAITLHSGVQIERLQRDGSGVAVIASGRVLPKLDRIVACTGFRPDLNLLSELRLGLDEAVQSPRSLAPLIDPNLHSCGTVRPHGAAELAHPEADFYIAGMKSYGRAPTFLLRTGYEQVRSIAAALAGDWEAARRVELVLPETGVCSTALLDDIEPVAATAGCCSSSAAVCAPVPRCDSAAACTSATGA